jgi:hypothetical protein
MWRDAGSGSSVIRNEMSEDNLKWNDMRSEDLYQVGFDGPESQDLNAWLWIFVMWLRFAFGLVALDSDPRSGYSVFKLKFLTLFQVVSSLRRLRRLRLTGRSERIIDSVVTGTAQLNVRNKSMRGLRDALMHYGLADSLDVTSLDLGKPMYGLCEHYFRGLPFEELSGIVEEAGGLVIALIYEGPYLSFECW